MHFVVRAMFAAALAAAVSGVQAADEPAAMEREGVPLRIGNRTVFEFRAPLGSYSPRERADAAARRIESVLAQDGAPATATRATAEGTLVLAADQGMFVVTPVDINALAGDTVDSVAIDAARRLQQAMTERRESLTPRAVAIATALAAAATLAYVLVLVGVIRIGRRAGGRLSAGAATRAGKLNVSGALLLDSSHVLRLTRSAVRAVLWVAALVATYIWFTVVLERFAYTRPWGEELEGNFLGILGRVFGAIAAAVPGLVAVALIYVIARTIVGMAGHFFARVERREVSIGGLDADTARPTRRILTVVIWLFALAMAYPYLPGAQTDAFKGLSVLVGLMVSIGASSVVGQGANGLILMYTRAFRSGEYVRIGEKEGTIVDLGMFTTRLRTGLGEEVMLPNSVVMAAPTTNYSRAAPGTGFVVHTGVTIGYSTPWRQVHAMLEEAARRTARIVAEPKPFVRQTALSDFYVEYRLVAYSAVERPPERAELLGELHANIQDVFNEYGVQILSPHYVTDPASPHVVPKERWYLSPAPKSP
jgi:small-conductance mechanosensitive channel